MDDNKVIIIGGGIGGLTAAVGLQQQGIPVAIHERQPELMELGTGVGIQRVARQAIAMLGLEDALRSIESDRYDALVHVSYKDGRTLATIPWHRAVAAVHRGELLEILKRALGDLSAVRCSSECVGFEQDADGVTARFADGSDDRGIALVGADGLHSVIRRQVVNDGKPRYWGWTIWRGMPEYTPSLASDRAHQIWGPATVFGMYPVHSRLFWYAGAMRPEGSGDQPVGRKRDLLDIFGGWPDGVPDVIGATPEEIIDRQDVYDRDPVSRWSDRRVTLLGDAAHPTMPSLGQGAGMAIEDGAVIARELAAANALDADGAVEAALKRYEEARIPRTAGIVKRSRRMSRINSLKRAPAVALREKVQSSLPESFWQRLWEHEGTYQL